MIGDICERVSGTIWGHGVGGRSSRTVDCDVRSIVKGDILRRLVKVCMDWRFSGLDRKGLSIVLPIRVMVEALDDSGCDVEGGSGDVGIEYSI